MILSQFINTIIGISNDRHTNTIVGIYRHLKWQIRKMFDLYPFEQVISSSRIIARHKKCGVSALINCRNMYDYNNMHLIKLLLRNGGIFLDAGANIGSYTLIASEQSNAFVYSFEPHPFTFQLLKQNLLMNKRDNVHAVNIALGNKKDKVLITNSDGSAVNYIVNDVKMQSNNAIEVECMRIDELCDKHGILPGFAKIDVEGYEFEVLEGFGNYLKSMNVIFIELNGLANVRSHGEGKILEILKENNLFGPYYFDYDKMTLSSTRNGEDSVFISEMFVPEITNLGITIN